MALIRCGECSRDISDSATACPGCGAPVVLGVDIARAPDSISYSYGIFIATKSMMAELAKLSVLACNYRIDAADDVAGTVSFTTGMTMGSFSGVSGTLVYREMAPFRFEVAGTAKQNLRGGQAIALDLFGESNSKIGKVLAQMEWEASAGSRGVSEQGDAPAATGCAIMAFGLIGLGTVAAVLRTMVT